MSSILQELEQEIANASTSAGKTNVGIIREIGDGVAKVEGLSDCQLNEMISFPGGVTGLAMNLEEGEVGAVLLGEYLHLKAGDECQTTGKLLSVPVGEALLGRVIDSLGNPIDGKGDIEASAQYPVEKLAPGIIKRKSVSVPLSLVTVVLVKLLSRLTLLFLSLTRTRQLPLVNLRITLHFTVSM